MYIIEWLGNAYLHHKAYWISSAIIVSHDQESTKRLFSLQQRVQNLKGNYAKKFIAIAILKTVLKIIIGKVITDDNTFQKFLHVIL